MALAPRNTPPMFRYVRPLLALFSAMSTFVILVLIITRKIPEGNRDIVNVALGVALASNAAIYSYYFGNNKDKSDQEQSAREKETVKDPAAS